MNNAGARGRATAPELEGGRGEGILEGGEVGADAGGDFSDGEAGGGDGLHAADGLDGCRGDGALELGGELGG
jgi:hypothetical protein